MLLRKIVPQPRRSATKNPWKKKRITQLTLLTGSIPNVRNRQQQSQVDLILVERIAMLRVSLNLPPVEYATQDKEYLFLSREIGPVEIQRHFHEPQRTRVLSR